MSTQHAEEPNTWGCYDPQCGDSTWDHECPVTPPAVLRAVETSDGVVDLAAVRLHLVSARSMPDYEPEDDVARSLAKLVRELASDVEALLARQSRYLT